jgi:hypothetical protein
MVLPVLSRPYWYVIATLPILVVAHPIRAQIAVDVGAGMVARWSEASSMSRTHVSGLAAEMGLSRAHGPTTRIRLDLGGSVFLGQSIAMPSCVPGAECRTMRSLSRAAHVAFGVDRPLAAGSGSPRIIVGAGGYWTGTGGADAADGKRSAFAPGVNAGLSVGTGRVRLDGRGHLPIGDLAEVQATATVLLRVALTSNR